jgi:hypothetical protein
LTEEKYLQSTTQESVLHQVVPFSIADLVPFSAAEVVPFSIAVSITKHSDENHPRKPEFEIHSNTEENFLIMMSTPTEYLWTLFGFQTTFGLIRWILRRETRVHKKQIKDFARKFLSSALENWRPTAGVPSVP